MISQQRTVRENLNLLMQLHDIKEMELARRSKVPQPTIHRLLSGATPDPRLSSLKVLARYFKVTLGQLVGEEPLVTTTPSNGNNRQLINLPLLPWDKAHEWQKLIKDYVPSNWSYWITTSQAISTSSYALTIENRHLPLPFIFQSIIVVDPDLKVKDNHFVVVYRKSDRSTTIKKTTYDGAMMWLVPLHEKISATPYDSDFLICGVVTQANLPLVP